MTRHILLLLLMLAAVSPATAQKPVDETWREIYTQLSDLDDFDEEGWAEAYEVLSAMAERRQNINEATFEDFRQVPLLTERQAIALVNYINLYGVLHTMAELTLVTDIDPPRRRLLEALFYAAPPSTPRNYWADRLLSDSLARLVPDSLRRYRHADATRHSLLLTMNVPTYRRQGQRDGTYLGPPLSHTVRYRFKQRHVEAAITAAQDAGEPFFAGGNGKGWDFYTGFVRLRNIGRLTSLVAGHYQMSMGMGLLLNNSYRLSRTGLLLTTPKSFATLRGHASRQYYNYLQGVAATVTLPLGGGKTIAVTPFVSYRALDATPSADSPGTVTTLLATGYHRTASELARRNATRQTVAGAAVEFTAMPLRLGLNIVHVALRDTLLPDKRQTYRWYYPTGRSFTSASLSYGYISSRLTVSGETALSPAAKCMPGDGGVAVATCNSATLRLSPSWHAVVLQRFYGYRFQTLLGKSFGDIAQVRNESGVYVGATTTCVPRLTLSAYVDCARHTWPRFGYDGTSRSWDTYLTATYRREAITATLRYRYREQALTSGSVMPQYSGSLAGTAQHTLRLVMKRALDHWTTQTQAQATYLPTSSDWGFLLSQGVGYDVKRWSLWASLAYFDTSAFASRLYLTDRSLTYGSLAAMVYGRGLRLNVIAQAQLGSHATLSLRSATLRYLDRHAISTGPQLIASASQTDVQVQLAMKF